MTKPTRDHGEGDDFDHPLEVILGQALRQPTLEAREHYLAEACGEDAALRAQVESLLVAHDRAGGFLEEPVIAVSQKTEVISVPAPQKPGDRIGHYKLLEQIGEGGCGVVYVAEQEAPVRRRVALKVIKLGMDTKAVIARFEAERQALALMDHPNIAKVFDAGATETGRPYFVMELVRGIKITEYCAQNKLSSRERLELAVQVCHAIQHAHQKGIIHRDIKPSNILVMMADDKPVPKVIDFGIAKATTQQPLTDKTLYTAFEQFIGTPAYMSPEQAGISGLDIDTRSDIYSLGVLLYELLTGSTPFDTKELLESGLDHMRQIIREREPVRPSTRLTQIQSASPAQIANRKSKIENDLDWIVMKCLEKDRTRRYETANGLAGDIEHHLSHEPVQARPPSRVYQFRKWARRNRVAFAAGSAVVAGLAIAFVTLVLWGLSEQAYSRSERVRSQLLQRELARQYLRQGQAAGEQGRIVQALHWMVRSLKELPDGNPGLKRTIEENLAAWGEEWVAPKAVLYGESGIPCADLSPDGRWVATGTWSGALWLWSNATAQTEWIVEQAHQGSVQEVVFSSDGNRLMTGGRDDGIARIWSVASGRQIGADMVHQGRLTGLAFSQDGRRVLTGSKDGTAKLWSTETGELIWTFSHEGEPVWVVALSPDGRTAATGGSKGVVKLWSTASGELLFPPLLHWDWVTALAFSPDGQTIITECLDGASRLWSAVTGKPLGKAMYAGSSWGPAAFSPGGDLVIAAGLDGSVLLYSATTGEPASRPLRHREKYYRSAKFTQDGTVFLTVPYGDAVQLWSVKDCLGRQGISFTQPKSVVGARFTPDGASIAVYDPENVTFWSPSTGQSTEMSHPAGITYVAAIDISPDGGEMLVGGPEGTARLLDLVTGAPLPVELVQSNGIASVDFSPDGKYVATGGGGRSRIWLTATGEALSPWLEQATFVVFSPVAEVLATGEHDGSVRQWTVPDGKHLPRMEGRHDGLLAINFSPDGRLIATGGTDHTARIWNAETGEPTTVVLVLEGVVDDVAFSPDGRWLLTTSRDCTARLWSVATGEQIGPSLRHQHYILEGGFSPDGSQIIAADAVYPRVWKVFTPLTSERLGNAKLWVENLTRTTMDEHGTVHWLSSEGR